MNHQQLAHRGQGSTLVNWLSVDSTLSLTPGLETSEKEQERFSSRELSLRGTSWSTSWSTVGELFVELVALVALSVILPIAGVLWLNDSNSVNDVYKNTPQGQFLFGSQTEKKENRIIFIEEWENRKNLKKIFLLAVQPLLFFEK